MNINRLYVATIYINIKRELNSDCKYESNGIYLKDTIVYHDHYDRYIDLISDEEYKLKLQDTYLGEMYIYLKNGMIPITEAYDITFKKMDMPKRRILKKINGAKLLSKKEDDK